MTTSKTILVTGATGTVAGPLTHRLARDPTLQVHALVRDPARAGALADAGVKLVRGSFEDAASLTAAMQGVDTLVLVTPANPRASEQAHAAIEAARAAHVTRIVRLSAIKADPEGPTENTRQHGRTEAELRASGIAWASLRPVAYLQNLLWSLQSVMGQGQLFHGVGTAKVGLVDTRDVTDALARLAVDPSFDGTPLELSGPRSVGYDEIAAALSRGLGRTITPVAVLPEDTEKAMLGFGMDPWFARLARDYDAAYRSGWGDFTTDVMQRLTGHPGRELDAFVDEVFVPAARAAP